MHFDTAVEHLIKLSILPNLFSSAQQLLNLDQNSLSFKSFCHSATFQKIMWNSECLAMSYCRVFIAFNFWVVFIQNPASNRLQVVSFYHFVYMVMLEVE